MDGAHDGVVIPTGHTSYLYFYIYYIYGEEHTIQLKKSDSFIWNRDPSIFSLFQFDTIFQKQRKNKYLYIISDILNLGY